MIDIKQVTEKTAVAARSCLQWIKSVPARIKVSPRRSIIAAVMLCAVLAVIICLAADSADESGETAGLLPSGNLSSSTPGYTPEQYNCDFSFPEEDSETLRMADGLMADALYVRDTMEPAQYKAAAIDWDIQAGDSPNTFQLYLQALNPMIYLAKGYELTGNTAYLDRAEQFLWSWNEYQSDPESDGRNPYLWNDHGAAIRAENLIYYYFIADRAGRIDRQTEDFILEMLEKHAQYLADDSNYTENHNHGIFQDRALIYIAYFLEHEDREVWLSHAKTRLEEQKTFAFTEEMVHVENSPVYHLSVMDTFRIISEFLVQFDDPYGGELYASISRSAEFMAYIIKPDGHIAEIGDTDSSADTGDVDIAGLGSEHLTYSCTQGAEGSAPEASAAFWPESGYFISRGWQKENFSQSTWTVFKSGYSSATHKHSDDNSFMLYTRGYDVFVDPGYHNYMVGSRYSDYLSSAGAHNTVTVDDRSYSPTAENSHLTGIYDYSDGEDYDYVLGVNDMYAGVSFDRHYYSLGEAIIIYDDLVSQEEHTYSQLFHLGENAAIVTADYHSVVIKVGDTDTFVRIRQLGAHGSLSVITGDYDDAQYGYISRQLNQLDTISTLKFDLTGTSVSFVTLITIEDAEGNIIGIDDISYTGAGFEVQSTGGSFTVDLRSRERVDAGAVSMAQTGSEFTFTSENSGERLEFAWEIISKANAKTVFISDYSADSTFSYAFTQPGEYLVRAHLRDGSLERSAIVADILCGEEGECTDLTAQFPCPELMYYGHSYEDLGGGTYAFTLDFDYSWDYSIRWYVYKNGAYYDTKTVTDSKTLTCTFDENAEYTVIYYLRTAGGNNECWNFPAIEVGVQQ